MDNQHAEAFVGSPGLKAPQKRLHRLHHSRQARLNSLRLPETVQSLGYKPAGGHQLRFLLIVNPIACGSACELQQKSTHLQACKTSSVSCTVTNDIEKVSKMQPTCKLAPPLAR